MTTEVLAVRDGTAALARDPADLAPRFVVSLDDLKRQVEDLQRFKRDIMIEGEDYGTIPGTPKPTLLKPGAEKLTLVFGLAPTFVNVGKVEDWEGGFFHYEEECRLTSKRTGELVASANGSANTKEPRYRWRDAKPTCPSCGHDLRRSRNRDGETGEPGWYCWAKVGGCGANYPAAQITVQGRIENPEPFELVNTVKKMAQKRALVAAALIATGGSGIWTQDIEDMPSVSGEGQIVDVTPRQPTAPTREREVTDAPRPNGQANNKGLVTSADDPMWGRWLELKSEADGLGVKIAEDVRLPIGRQLLQSAGLKVREDLKARHEQLAREDADRAAGAAQHAEQGEMVKSAKAAVMQELAGVIEQAADGGLDVEPFRVTLPALLSEVRAKIAAAQQAIDKAMQPPDEPF